MLEDVFARGERHDLGPADHGEPRYTYLDRSARPQFAAARNQINNWFRRLDSSMQPGVLARLRSKDDHEFAAGYWELYLHELLTRLGFELVCEPVLPTGRKIDFLARRGSSGMYLEATVAHSSKEERSADARRNRLYRELEKVNTDQFMLGIQIELAGRSDLPNVGELRKRLEDWLSTLDPDVLTDAHTTSMSPPEFQWEANGWRLSFDAFPMKPEYRGKRIDRPLGSFMDETGGLIDDETPLRRALDRKLPRKYGALELPYVIAVCEYSWEYGPDDWHRRNVLFGRSGIAFGDSTPPHAVRATDGFWRGPGQRPRNTRVAAVLLASNLQPWKISDDDLAWWDNPVAESPVADDAVLEVAKRHQVVLVDGRGDVSTTEPTRSLGEVLGVGPLST